MATGWGLTRAPIRQFHPLDSYIAHVRIPLDVLCAVLRIDTRKAFPDYQVSFQHAVLYLDADHDALLSVLEKNDNVVNEIEMAEIFNTTPEKILSINFNRVFYGVPGIYRYAMVDVKRLTYKVKREALL